LPSPAGSTAAPRASVRQRAVFSLASAVASPFTYRSNQAPVYQAAMSMPRRVAPNPGFGMYEYSKWVPPRVLICPESTPAVVRPLDAPFFDCSSGAPW
jgi:hypothetical protein